jgi:uncharacterized membrane protein YheB (UPF0754 family)
MKLTKKILTKLITEELENIRENEISETATEVLREYLASIREELGKIWDGNREEVLDETLQRATIEILNILEGLNLSSIPEDGFSDSTGTAYDDETHGRDLEIEPD